ncbi:hypothetical protein IJI76_03025 [Candidatus Saccharibacteria bacterium]|nr:hypothetical protein [Candidatus Saccharibacteria bacterium]
MMMGGRTSRRLTIVEGRELNQNMARELVEASERAGFKTELIKVLDETKIVDGRLEDLFPDMILWRSPINYSSGTAVERALYWINKNRKITINTKVAGGRSFNSNKYFQHEMFMDDPVVRKHTLPCFPAFNKEFIKKRLIGEGRISYPFVLKPDMGTRGIGIKLIRNEQELDDFNENLAAFSVEKFVKSTYDWRVFTLGGIALGNMKKLGNEDDPADFIAKSAGKKRWTEDDEGLIEEMYEIAVHAAAACGLEYAGVDLIRDDETGEFYVLETNVAGGWQNGFFESTGVNVPDKIMEWFSDRAEFFSERRVNVSVENYVLKRLPMLSRKIRRAFSDITEFKWAVNRSRDLCNADLVIREMPLIRKLESAYLLVQDENLKGTDLARIEALIDSIEKYDISGYGNFVGRDSGSLEDSAIETAFYLAICKKLNRS